MKKRLCSILVCGAMLLSALPIGAGALGEPAYEDILPNHWAEDAVEYLYYTGIMLGTSQTTFSPAGAFTRAMFVTMLGRLEGVDPNDYSGSAFSDVKAGTWYAPYVTWAAARGIVNGTSPTAFSPNAVITREQYCTIVDRYLQGKFPGYDDYVDSFRFFEDQDSISGYAYQGVCILTNLGLCNLYENNRVRPRGKMSRIEVAGLFAQLTRWMEGDDVAYPIPEGNPAGLYLQDYLGLPLRGVTALYGSDLYCHGALTQIPEAGLDVRTLYYEDDRLDYTFGYNDLRFPLRPQGPERICMVGTFGGTQAMVTPEISAQDNCYTLGNKGYYLDIAEGFDPDMGATAQAVISLDDGLLLRLQWYQGSDPYEDVPDYFMLVRFA